MHPNNLHGRQTIAGNAFALLVVQVANVLLPLVTLPYLLRVLGVEQFGVFAFCQAILAYCVVLVDYGFNLSATKLIAQNQGKREAINQIFWSVQVVKLLIALIILSLLGLLTWIVPSFRAVWPVILSSTPIILGSLLFPQWLFQGLERMGFVAASIMFARLLTIPLIFLWVNNSHDTWLAALIQSCGTIFSGLLACSLIWRKRLIGFMHPKWEDVRQALSDGWHIFISTAAISLYTTINPVLLGILTNNTLVGLFSAADKIRIASQSIISPLSVAVYPRVGALMAKNRQDGLLLVRKLLFIQGGLTLCISFAMWSLAPWIVLFVMGQEYDAAVSVLRVMAPLPFLIGLSNVFGIQTMLPLGLEKSFSRIVMLSGIINISLILALAPVWGAEGAAAAIVITESLVTLAMVLVVHSANIHIFTPNHSTPS